MIFMIKVKVNQKNLKLNLKLLKIIVKKKKIIMIMKKEKKKKKKRIKYKNH